MDDAFSALKNILTLHGPGSPIPGPFLSALLRRRYSPIEREHGPTSIVSTSIAILEAPASSHRPGLLLFGTSWLSSVAISQRPCESATLFATQSLGHRQTLAPT